MRKYYVTMELCGNPRQDLVVYGTEAAWNLYRKVWELWDAVGRCGFVWLTDGETGEIINDTEDDTDDDEATIEAINEYVNAFFSRMLGEE